MTVQAIPHIYNKCFSSVLDYANDIFMVSPMDKGAWQATVHKLAKSQIWLKWLSTQVYMKLFYLGSNLVLLHESESEVA